MDLMQALRDRHAVRSYTDQKIEEPVLQALREEIAACNGQGGLDIQLVTDEPEAFGSLMARCSGFRGVRNYLLLAGEDIPDLPQRAGYFGQRLALRAGQLGLNSCWVAGTYRKNRCAAVLKEGQKLVCVIALGHGTTQGTAHKSKPLSALCRVNGPMPDWFRAGMEAAMLAPTPMNQQKFIVSLADGAVQVHATGGSCAEVNVGIVKYHFECGAGQTCFLPQMQAVC